MLGLIGAVVFGAVFAGSWMIAEDRERTSRENSKKSGNSLYIDKNGRFRHTDTGKKYSTEDAIKNIEKFNREREERRKQLTECHVPKYWGFKRCDVIKSKNEIIIDSFGIFSEKKPIIELFDNYDDCKRAYEILREEYLVKGVSSYDIFEYNPLEHYCDNDINNFKYNKYSIHNN